MGVSINIDGVGNVKTKMSKLPAKLMSKVTASMKTAVLVVEAGAKLNCPVGETGNLRGSITSKTTRSGDSVVGSVYTACEYAPYVEFGTGRRGGYPYKTSVPLAYSGKVAGQAAQPFLGRSLNENKDTVKDILSQAIRINDV